MTRCTHAHGLRLGTRTVGLSTPKGAHRFLQDVDVSGARAYCQRDRGPVKTAATLSRYFYYPCTLLVFMNIVLSPVIIVGEQQRRGWHRVQTPDSRL